MADPLGGKEPVAEVRLRRRARADRRARRGEEVELRAVGVRRVDDRRALAEAACAAQAARSGGTRARRGTPRSPAAARRRERGAGAHARRRTGRSPRASRADRRGRSAGRARRGCPGARSSSTSARYADTDSWRKRARPPRAYATWSSTRSTPAASAASAAANASASAEVVELSDRRVAGRPHLAVDRARTRRARAPASGAPPRRASCRRHAQKSPPAARPRSARWNVWL